MKRVVRFFVVWLAGTAVITLGGYVALRYLLPTERWARDAIEGFFREQGVSARVNDLGFRPPATVLFEQLAFQPIDNPTGAPPFVIERGELYVKPAALLHATVQLGYRFELWGGRIEGTLTTRREGREPAVRIEAEFSELDLARITGTDTQPPVMVGRLGGQAVVGWTGIDSRQARGTVDLVARNGSVALPVRMPDGTESLPFDRLDVPLVLELPVVRINRALLDGPAPLEVTGRVIVGEGAPGTILDLRVRLPMRRPDGSIDFDAALTFGLKGTAARPQISA